MGTVFDVSGNTAYSPKNPYNGTDLPFHYYSYYRASKTSVYQKERYQLTKNPSVRRERRLTSSRSIVTQARGL